MQGTIRRGGRRPNRREALARQAFNAPADGASPGRTTNYSSGREERTGNGYEHGEPLPTRTLSAGIGRRRFGGFLRREHGPRNPDAQPQDSAEPRPKQYLPGRTLQGGRARPREVPARRRQSLHPLAGRGACRDSAGGGPPHLAQHGVPRYRPERSLLHRYRCAHARRPAGPGRRGHDSYGVRGVPGSRRGPADRSHGRLAD